MSRKSYSAGVLDEADSAQNRVNWVLFCQEQSRILYSGDYGMWKPGVPLYRRPHWHISCFTPEPTPFSPARCVECDVFWRGDEPCFVCGEERSIEIVKVHLRPDYIDDWIRAELLYRDQYEYYRRMWEGARLWAEGDFELRRRSNVVVNTPRQHGLDLRHVLGEEFDLDLWARNNEAYLREIYGENYRDDYVTYGMHHDRETIGLLVLTYRVSMPVLFQHQEPRLEAIEELLWAFRQRRVVEPVVEVGDAVERQREIERVNAPIDWRSIVAGWERSYDRRRDGR